MPDSPKFFVPFTNTPEDAERAYAQLAALNHKDVPEVTSRIYSITFAHNGNVWTATVGKSMEGLALAKGRDRHKPPKTYEIYDPALVIAIFAGVQGAPGVTEVPWVVVTDANPRSNWDPMFLAAQPNIVKYFALGEE